MPTFGTPSRFASRFGSGCAHPPQVRQLETWDLFGRYKSILQSRTKFSSRTYNGERGTSLVFRLHSLD
jgi:hypothetical protein